MSTANLKPYGSAYNSDLNESVIFDRLYRPLIRVRGRYPRCDFASAVALDADGPKLYGLPNTAFLYHDDNAPRCCPIVRQRLADLLARCPVLAAEIKATQQGERGCEAGTGIAAIPCGSHNRNVRGDGVTDNEKTPRRDQRRGASIQPILTESKSTIA